MSRTQVRVGNLFGVPVRVDLSWLLVFVWVTWSLAGSYFPGNYPSWSPGLYWGLAILTSLLFFGSVLLHEMGHALVARAQGTPVKDITLFIFGGAANIEDEPQSPIAELRMALIGPLVSLAASGLFAAVHLLARPFSEPIAALGLFLGGINLSLGLFNLIPGFPLDGGRVLRSVLWYVRKDLTWATRWASRIGHIVAYVFILIGVVQAFAGNWVDGLWLAFIGWFLDNAARTSYQQLSLRNLLDGHSAGEIMSGDCTLLPPQVTLDVLIEQHILSGAKRCFTVGANGRVDGLLTLHNVRAVPKVDWPFIHAGDVLTPLDQLRKVEPDTPLYTVLQHMSADGVNQVPVMSGDTLVGMVTREDLVTFIRNRAVLAS